MILIALFVICSGSSGCTSIRYIARQASGQLRVLTARQPIEKLLRQKHGLSAAQRAKLEFVQRTRRFAIDQIGLRRTAAYTYFYDTGNKPVAYNVSAAPKTALRPVFWSFPIVGRVPYLGFFRESDAVKRRDALVQQGLDTLLRPVPAYSSLGWFADPVYSTMLDNDRWRIAEIVIHEMTHTTLFLRGRVAFNESLAMLVGQQGAIELARAEQGDGAGIVEQLQASLDRRRQFSALLEQLFSRLKTLYGSKLSRDEKIRRRSVHFAWAQQRYRKLFGKHAGGFATAKLNNAVLLSYGRYNRGLRFHREIYRRLGNDLQRLIEVYKYAARFPNPPRYLAWRFGLTPP
ncbi:MAG: aminopeptidase [Deltaproteobacteria bacterium]|nr:aminopeptidase [Deltaproteobacteria bacterium]